MKPFDERSLSLPYSEEDPTWSNHDRHSKQSYGSQKSAWYPDARTLFAELIVGAPASLPGLGGRDGPSTAAYTVIASLCPPGSIHRYTISHQGSKVEYHHFL